MSKSLASLGMITISCLALLLLAPASVRAQNDDKRPMGPGETTKTIESLLSSDPVLSDVQRKAAIDDLTKRADDSNIIRAIGQLMKGNADKMADIIAIIVETETLGFSKIARDQLASDEFQATLIKHYFHVKDHDAAEDLVRLWLEQAPNGKNFGALTDGFGSVYMPVDPVSRLYDGLGKTNATKLIKDRVEADKLEEEVKALRETTFNLIKFQWGIPYDNADDLHANWKSQKTAYSAAGSTKRMKGDIELTADFDKGLEGAVRRLDGNLFFLGGSYTSTEIDPKIVDEGYGMELDVFIFDPEESRPLIEFFYDDSATAGWSLSINDKELWRLNIGSRTVAFTEAKPKKGAWNRIEMTAILGPDDARQGVTMRSFTMKFAKGNREKANFLIGKLTKVKISGSGRFVVRPIGAWNIAPGNIG